MRTEVGPLTLQAVLTSWQFDAVSVVVVLALAVGYGWCVRRSGLRGRPVWCFGVAALLWLLATVSMIGVYAYVLFWVRALQVVLLLLVVPFFLASATPVTALRAALPPAGRDRLDRLLAGWVARVLLHPATTSIAMLGTPWLLYLTPWYTAALQQPAVAEATRILLVAIGFGYFYARLQADPVPRRYSQLISLLISVVESIGDGVLGIVLWLGPLIAPAYYAALHRDWGPSARMDQVIGAGVLWILGDVLGVPFLIVLMRALSADEKAHAAEVDAELDRAEAAEAEKTEKVEKADESGQPKAAEEQARPALWWEADEQLSQRFRRR
ncbi:cytochrome c oxidase assembly protein [Mycobacterium aquaticum]|uniref:Copper resistance protein CopD n=1 Tax=Mycobacterium aquaticum TaxID=1927124 RepID=A0A1X0AEK5_9MYCO|nr:cytochrome c oxidase assembly protein [Mycobacterium aquaticum]ORA28288.1 copper resistance protein CopD [Mycobacterium aquaticum]